jgi:hypothetical protein
MRELQALIRIMVTYLFALFSLYLISFPLTSCSYNFNIDDITTYTYNNNDSDYDEEVIGINNSFNDFHDSLKSKVSKALQFSPIWTNETDDAENKSEYVLEDEEEEYEIDHYPEAIEDLSASPSKIEKNRPISCDLANDRRLYIRKDLLERFQKETGHTEAKNIKWKLLDKSRIPSEYDGIEIGSYSMSKPSYFDNPDIVDNIHFKRFMEDRLDSKADASNIVPVNIYEKCPF